VKENMSKRPQNKYLGTLLAIAIVFVFLAFFVVQKNSAASASELSQEQSRALQDINKYRAEIGLSELRWSGKLAKAAQQKLIDEDLNDYFGHISPDGRDAWDFIEECGYKYRYAGENLAIDFKDEQDAFNAWINSETHRKNIVSEKYNEFGFATLKANINGRERVLMVQLFGSRNTTFDRILSN
jgi:uncharacterized protein YkwD